MSDCENPYAGIDLSDLICGKHKDTFRNIGFVAYFVPTNSAGDLEAYHDALMDSQTNPIWYMNVLPESWPYQNQ